MEFLTIFQVLPINRAIAAAHQDHGICILRKKSKKSGDAKMGMSIITGPTIDVNQTKVQVAIFKWNAYLLNRKRKFKVTAYTSK